ncbi:hypothetical protein NE562_15280 [Butyricicoccus faecihominis]|uniref:hypothetical protein n=1 Tax=Butyricicoccaceae TaxID=3085642 RepID=UPI002479DDE1|nr:MULTISPECIES: hypothetical protein [Butyricicoccaceae]MCQ5131026.1 hypothetical protein [Butyricicoccus faecihominis]WNX85086.1 hypothetical protein RWV98_02070 [Agathobaculum sp. NTUH-O15-33]
MKKMDRHSLCAVMMALTMLFTGAFSPLQPKGAWWCTAFSVLPEQAAETQRVDDGEVVFKWKLGEWLGQLLKA